VHKTTKGQWILNKEHCRVSAVVSLQLFQDSQHNGFNTKLQMSALINDLAVTTWQFKITDD